MEVRRNGRCGQWRAKAKDRGQAVEKTMIYMVESTMSIYESDWIFVMLSEVRITDLK
jgi:hypothetical protein